jgi:UDP-galactopyranose mutase
MLEQRNISIQLNTYHADIKDQIDPRHTVYTGPIDAYTSTIASANWSTAVFWFEHEHLGDTEWFQPVQSVKYSNDHAYTRMTEFKHATDQTHLGTLPWANTRRPKATPAIRFLAGGNEEQYQQCKAMAEATLNVTFVGRLAQYRC